MSLIAPLRPGATVLLTGGGGYIGSHTVVALTEAGYRAVIFDNFCNSRRDVAQTIKEIVGAAPIIVEGDTRDRKALENALTEHSCAAVIHLAGLKAVAESVQLPLAYYDNNMVGSLHLLEAMHATGVRKLVFSSSATVYGEPEDLPITETHPLRATNAYGRSKLAVEAMLGDLHRSDPSWSIAILRYFNPTGAHESGLIGEDPLGEPSNLMPLITRVAAGQQPMLDVWGGDYPTNDGTGVRDYIHVMDLAEGHVNALERTEVGACSIFNLGTGCGYTVLEMLQTFEVASGRRVPFRIRGRRPGDVASAYADVSLAADKLGWRAKRSVAAMCADQWRWHSRHCPIVERADGGAP